LHDDHGNKAVRLGLKVNITQFLILVIVNAFVGSMVGLEQTVVPLLGRDEFHIESNALIVSFIASFGAVKAVLNLFAGSISDKWGRKNMLVLGWLFGLPFPVILLFSPNWSFKGRGRSKYEPEHVGTGVMEYVPDFGHWTKIEVLVADSQVKQIVDDLLQSISRGSPSDGKIFVYDVAEAIDIGTKRTGNIVL
jgi:nitrogen regulatory protein PII